MARRSRSGVAHSSLASESKISHTRDLDSIRPASYRFRDMGIGNCKSGVTTGQKQTLFRLEGQEPANENKCKKRTKQRKAFEYQPSGKRSNVQSRYSQRDTSPKALQREHMFGQKVL